MENQPEPFIPPTHFYLKNGKPYILREMGKIYVDSKPSRDKPNLIILRDAERFVTRLVGEWNEHNQRYEYAVFEGLSERGNEMKNLIKLMYLSINLFE